MTAGRDVHTLRRLERTLVGIRWFGVAFAVFQVWQLNFSPVEAPDYAAPTSYALAGLVAAGNLLIMWALRTVSDEAGLRRLGVGAFALDTAVLFAFVWLFSYDRNDFTWVLLYILPLEGALRYRMRGAFVIWGVTAAFELAREIYRTVALEDYPFFVGALTFRVGIDAIIAFFAGYMANSLQRQAQKAERRALESEHLADREIAARKELSAFHATVMAGVAAKDLEPALQSMVEQIGPALGLESLLIAVIEGEHIRPAAVWGLSADLKQVRLRKGEGLTGQAWERGRAILEPDVASSQHYVMADPTVVAELVIPLRVGNEILGVLDVESRRTDHLTPSLLDLLGRLADQVALVMYNARALTRQREAIEGLRELDEMKSDFVAITSHELRTPLTAIRGFVDMLRAHFDRFSPEERRHFLDVIDDQGRKLSRLLEDLLVVSRVEAGHMPVHPEEVSIGALLADVKASFETEGDRVHVVARQDGPAILDPHRTSQVLRNLVHNALKFSPPGAPVDVEGGRSNGVVSFTVRDRGVGIAPDQIERIFDRFHQAGSAVSRDEEGAGLGLYISKRLVEAMGGNIEVTSSPGEGAEFRVSLPQDEEPASPRPPAAAPAG